MKNDRIAAINALLQGERQAILQGAYDGLAGIAERKAALMTDLAQGAIDRAALRQIQSDIAHNQDLLAAAIAGVKSARLRLDELAKVRTGLMTYDAQGALSVHRADAHLLEKKA